MKKHIQIFNIVASILMSLLFVLLGVFVFRTSYLRLLETVFNLVNSIRFYFCAVFNIPNNIQPTVVEYSKVIKWGIGLASDFSGFKINAIDYFKLLLSLENFCEWIVNIGIKIERVSKAVVILLPCVLALVFAIKRQYSKHNTNHNADTLPLKCFKFLAMLIICPVKYVLREFVAFQKRHAWISKCWIGLWVLQLNIVSIVVEFVAFYLYFVMAFRLDALYITSVNF